ncbi:MAG: DUF2264 domain-containing protein [Paludibacteraceae bacterium]
MKKKSFTLIFVFSLVGSFFAQDLHQSPLFNVFKVQNPDYTLSPYTGMTRRHWFDAAEYLLSGAFGYIHSIDDPMKFPKQEGKSYPHNDNQIPTEKMEGLCRTLFIAAPLLKENPDLVLNGIRVGDYYRHQICKLFDTNSPSYIKPRATNGGPSQNLVEFGALGISLFTIPEIIWNPLSQSQKDSLAAVMISYGDGPTISSNWRFFNIFVLSFFKSQGYAVNEKLLEEYLQKSLADYRGEGWYNDSPAYDYYSMWAFQLYGVLWAEYFGKEYYPQYARKFIDNFKESQTNYPYMFSKNGQMIMWGRSISYRFASIGIFPFMGLETAQDVDLGWMRKTASSTLLQFLQNPDFLRDNVPTLGFYGAYEPAVQIYSCRGSVYWMGKAFLGLFIPKDNPFWTKTETSGAWETKLEKGKTYNHFQKGTGILITNYPNIGAAEIRAWCYSKVKDDWQKFRSSENYNRLAYNSAFPWQADGKQGEVAMNYLVKNNSDEWEALRLYTFKKFENDIYYRNVELETDSTVKFNLADIPLPNGILRVDKLTTSQNTELRLGHYALPELDKPIVYTTKKIKGQYVGIIDNGKYQLAMISWQNKGKLEFIDTKNSHPQSKKSMVINWKDSFNTSKQHSKIYITLQLWKESSDNWTKDELIPIKKVTINNEKKMVRITMKNGTVKEVIF